MRKVSELGEWIRGLTVALMVGGALGYGLAFLLLPWVVRREAKKWNQRRY